MAKIVLRSKRRIWLSYVIYRNEVIRMLIIRLHLFIFDKTINQREGKIRLFFFQNKIKKETKMIFNR